MKKNKVLNLLFRIFVGVVVVLLIVTLPILGLKQNDEFYQIYSTFVGSKSKYQGILEVWNIDTFEGGYSAKSNYISMVAKSFEKRNKGLYVLVRNLTEYECLNLLAKGEKPDIFSCSYGVASEIKDNIVPFKNISDLEISSNVLASGKLNGESFGLAWGMGLYFLISTDSHLKNANIFSQNDDENLEKINNLNLADIALHSGYEKQGKKSTKITYSLVFGTNKYLLPNQAFSSYNNNGLISDSKFFLNDELKGCSQYTAYSNFVAEKSVVLLGSQRDLIKMKNREKNGKSERVYFQAITGFSDLVQFSFLAKNNNDLKLEYAESFAKLLSSREFQEKLNGFGLLSVCGNEENFSIGNETVKVDLEKIKLNNVFITKSEIFNLMK